MSNSRDSHKSSIPVLTDLIVPGGPAPVRHASPGAAVPRDVDEVPALDDMLETPAHAGHAHAPEEVPAPAAQATAEEPAGGAETARDAAHESSAEPVAETPPDVAAAAPPDVAPQAATETPLNVAPVAAPEVAAAAKVPATAPEPPAAKASAIAPEAPAAAKAPATSPEAPAAAKAPAAPPHVTPPAAASATVAPDATPKPAPQKPFSTNNDIAEVAATPFAEPYAPELASTHETPAPLDADLLAERLRARFTSYLNGAGREVIEERCQAAMQVHATWLVGQIAKEVAQVVETKMTEWVREAVKEEIARHSGV